VQTISYLRGFKLIFISSRSPKFLSLIIILVICVLRIIWFTVDPFIMKGLWNRSLERVLYECVFSFLYMLFSIILFVWFTFSNLVKNNVISLFRYIIFGELSYNIMHGFAKNKQANNSENYKYKKKWYCGIFQSVRLFLILKLLYPLISDA